MNVARLLRGHAGAGRIAAVPRHIGVSLNCDLITRCSAAYHDGSRQLARPARWPSTVQAKGSQRARRSRNHFRLGAKAVQRPENRGGRRSAIAFTPSLKSSVLKCAFCSALSRATARRNASTTPARSVARVD
jgi:hypothetical protein